MAIVFTKTHSLHELRSMRIVGSLTFSGSYVTGGEIPSGIIKPGTTKNPIMVSFYNKGDHTARYDAATGKVILYAPGGAQLGAAAYPAAVTNDTFVMEQEYPKFG
jgi:hypothetical protein